MNPNPLFMRHLKKAILRITNSSIQNNIVILQTIPTELTFTGAPYIIPYKSQGTGSLEKKISLVAQYFHIIGTIIMLHQKSIVSELIKLQYNIDIKFEVYFFSKS